MAGTSDCPNCGKKGLVQRGENVYQCLVCDFKRDLSEPKENGGGSVLGAVALTALMLLVFLA